VTPSEQIALWADMLRDMSASGLQYAPTVYDHDRYERIQNIAMEMLALATGQPLEQIEPLREPIFARPTPLAVGTAAIIDDDGKILLMRRSDNRLWVMPGGSMEVGETPAEGVVREALEETGVRCEPVALVGVYDSRVWDQGVGQHLYKFTFLCKPLGGGHAHQTPSHAHETLETGWFYEHALPDDLYQGHVRRIRDSFRAWRGEQRAYFD
jgi:ADP-ribose pyrophosphatase YjhB (NUDIX family)